MLAHRALKHSAKLTLVTLEEVLGANPVDDVLVVDNCLLISKLPRTDGADMEFGENAFELAVGNSQAVCTVPFTRHLLVAPNAHMFAHALATQQSLAAVQAFVALLPLKPSRFQQPATISQGL